MGGLVPQRPPEKSKGEKTIMWKFVAALASIVFMATTHARAQTMPEYATHVLVGSWQLVKFVDSNGQSVAPDNKANYTLAFDAQGQVSVRFDCNSGTAKWGTASKGEIHFEPLALTQAACPKGSLHDRLVKDWPLIRSYTQQNGQLYLALAAEGGSYHFQPTGPGKGK
jgi:heat shock protein HslJ